MKNFKLIFHLIFLFILASCDTDCKDVDCPASGIPLEMHIQNEENEHLFFTPTSEGGLNIKEATVKYYKDDKLIIIPLDINYGTKIISFELDVDVTEYQILFSPTHIVNYSFTYNLQTSDCCQDRILSFVASVDGEVVCDECDIHVVRL